MTKIIVKLVVKSIFATILYFGLFLLWMNVANYYDVSCAFGLTLPIVFIVRWMDDSIRDTIIILREDQTLMANIITGLMVFGTFIGAYLVYLMVFNQMDIFVNIFDFLGNYLPVDGIRNKFGIY